MYAIRSYYDLGGNHNYRDIGKLPNFPADRDTIHAGEHQVEQDQSWAQLFYLVDDLIATAQATYGETILDQIIPDQLRNLQLVFNN